MFAILYKVFLCFRMKQICCFLAGKRFLSRKRSEPPRRFLFLSVRCIIRKFAGWVSEGNLRRFERIKSVKLNPTVDLLYIFAYFSTLGNYTTDPRLFGGGIICIYRKSGL